MDPREQEIARLDMVARAYAAERGARSFLWWILLMVVMTFALAVGSRASKETTMCWAAAVAAIIAAVEVWFLNRYSILVLALCLLGFAVGHSWYVLEKSWVLGLVWLSAYGFWLRALFLAGVNYAKVHGDGWEDEHAQVSDWVFRMRYEETPDVLELQVRSFWTGHYDMYFLRAEDCWVVGKSKAEKVEWLSELRVCPLDAVQFVTKYGDDRYRLRVDGRMQYGARVSTQWREKFERLARSEVQETQR